MKRILLMIAVAVISVPAFAQAIVEEIDVNDFRRRVTLSNQRLSNAKRAQNGNIWMDRGNLMYEIASAVTSKVAPGTPLKAIETKFGKPTGNIIEKEVNGRIYKVVPYWFADFYVVEAQGIDAVQFWDENLDIEPDAAGKAYEAYTKAGELNSKLRSKAKDGILNVAELYQQEAYNSHSLGDVDRALANYENAYESMLNPLVNRVDTNSLFSAGSIYLTRRDYPNIIKTYEIAREHNIWNDGDVGFFLSLAYLETKQNDKAKEVLDQMSQLFPGSQQVTDATLNYYYYTGGDLAEIKDIVVQALENDPTNVSLLNQVGNIYLDEKNTEKAMEMYNRILQVEPDNYVALYYIADAWIDEGNTKMDQLISDYEAGKINERELEKKAEEYNDIYKKAIPYLDEAYRINPNEPAVVSRLHQIYSRLENEPGMKEKAAEYKKQYDELIKNRGE